MITEGETTLEELRNKHIAYEELKKSFDEVTHKLKHQEELMKELNHQNEELRRRLTVLGNEKEELTKSYRKTIEDRDLLKIEIDELVENNQELKMEIHELLQVREENEKLRQSQGDSSVINELREYAQQLEEEIQILKAAKSITFNAQYITNTTFSTSNITNNYIESIINNTSTQNTYITNIMDCQDIEQIKRELFGQLKKIDDTKHFNLQLLQRIHGIQHNFLVYIRTRPPNEEEANNGHLIIDNSNGSNDFSFFDSKEKDWVYHRFDGHWGYDFSQSDLFGDIEPLIASLVPNALDLLVETVNSTPPCMHSAIFAIGGADTGKTFTLYGFGAHIGIAFRAVQKIYELLQLQQQKLNLEKIQPTRHDIPEEEVKVSNFNFTVKLSKLEFVDGKMYDATHGKDNLVELTHVNDIVYDPTGNVVHISGLSSVTFENLHHAVETLLKASVEGGKAHHNATTVLEFTVEIKIQENRPPVVRKLSIIDTAPINYFTSDNQSNKELKAFNDILKQLENKEKESKLSYNSSKFTSVIRPIFGLHAKAMMVFNFAPTDLTLQTTKESLKLALRSYSIQRDSSHSSSTNSDSHDIVSLQKRIRQLTTQLQVSEAKQAKMLDWFENSRYAAEDAIGFLNQGNKTLLTHYNEEKDVRQQMQLDMQVIHRNLKRSMNELQEQRKVNDRLVQIVKDLEKEKKAMNILDSL